mgnify:FL=1
MYLIFIMNTRVYIAMYNIRFAAPTAVLMLQTDDEPMETEESSTAGEVSESSDAAAAAAGTAEATGDKSSTATEQGAKPATAEVCNSSGGQY